eukprot:gnl/Dysnectes_brevis/5386_a7723_387.p1 GENE.gnl/Dysnectes_brevis/5386_a7723_387~~gnl/Dysnectes_brevis/5386_a7723_387.p1  ORF type:complete len:1109 (+),score=154.64 gnl/Dysnectes_brevis/5386_a7723_387:108-3434(+)
MPKSIPNAISDSSSDSFDDSLVGRTPSDTSPSRPNLHRNPSLTQHPSFDPSHYHPKGPQQNTLHLNKHDIRSLGSSVNPVLPPPEYQHRRRRVYSGRPPLSGHQHPSPSVSSSSLMQHSRTLDHVMPDTVERGGGIVVMSPSKSSSSLKRGSHYGLSSPPRRKNSDRRRSRRRTSKPAPPPTRCYVRCYWLTFLVWLSILAWIGYILFFTPTAAPLPLRPPAMLYSPYLLCVSGLSRGSIVCEITVPVSSFENDINYFLDIISIPNNTTTTSTTTTPVESTITIPLQQRKFVKDRQRLTITGWDQCLNITLTSDTLTLLPELSTTQACPQTDVASTIEELATASATATGENVDYYSKVPSTCRSGEPVGAAGKDTFYVGICSSDGLPEIVTGDMYSGSFATVLGGEFEASVEWTVDDQTVFTDVVTPDEDQTARVLYWPLDDVTGSDVDEPVGDDDDDSGDDDDVIVVQSSFPDSESGSSSSVLVDMYSQMAAGVSVDSEGNIEGSLSGSLAFNGSLALLRTGNGALELGSQQISMPLQVGVLPFDAAPIPFGVFVDIILNLRLGGTEPTTDLSFEIVDLDFNIDIGESVETELLPVRASSFDMSDTNGEFSAEFSISVRIRFLLADHMFSSTVVVSLLSQRVTEDVSIVSLGTISQVNQNSGLKGSLTITGDNHSQSEQVIVEDYGSGILSLIQVPCLVGLIHSSVQSHSDPVMLHLNVVGVSKLYGLDTTTIAVTLDDPLLADVELVSLSDSELVSIRLTPTPASAGQLLEFTVTASSTISSSTRHIRASIPVPAENIAWSQFVDTTVGTQAGEGAGALVTGQHLETGEVMWIRTADQLGQFEMPWPADLTTVLVNITGQGYSHVSTEIDLVSTPLTIPLSTCSVEISGTVVSTLDGSPIDSAVISLLTSDGTVLSTDTTSITGEEDEEGGGNAVFSVSTSAFSGPNHGLRLKATASGYHSLTSWPTSCGSSALEIQLPPDNLPTRHHSATLTWGPEPLDLDLRLDTPISPSDGCTVSYLEPTCSYAGSESTLLLDDTQGWGPEMLVGDDRTADQYVLRVVRNSPSGPGVYAGGACVDLTVGGCVWPIMPGPDDSLEWVASEYWLL